MMIERKKPAGARKELSREIGFNVLKFRSSKRINLVYAYLVDAGPVLCASAMAKAQTQVTKRIINFDIEEK